MLLVEDKHMTQRLTGKRALVVGGSRGIGRAVVQALASEGATVVFSFVRNEGAARDVEAAVKAEGGRAIAARADSSKADDVRSLFETARTRGPIDIVINVAGVSKFGPIAAMSDEDFQQQLDVNTRGTFHVLREAASAVNDGGRVVVFSTGGTTSPSAAAGTYLATKAACEQLAWAFAREVGGRGITVNCISPGLTQTDGLVLPPEMLEAMVNQTPLGRLGQPADIAAAVVFLASDEGRWVTGHNLRVTGGL